ncbi:hypothetical protein ASG01_05350 [Chryseobacterium sp. Leaf180]|uniref:DUF885 domain-containing protein n=1 Tax=Chryseobacterium sp. Leaf180 TaxID=1736289 RepID=UPI0006F9A9B6|nr:DUF885 domain-containing protein [Chryseobacterium sp. Leaf180]KQR95273.1 hypothetical protein ASG01_05350 [Chryseobacterium sp. Leaf180]
MKKIIVRSFLSLSVAFAAGSCKKYEAKTAESQSANLNRIAADYYENYLKMFPLEATSQGDLRYNDQLPINFSQEFIDRDVNFCKSVLEKMKNVSYNDLTNDHKTVYDVLKYTLNERIEAYGFHPEYIPFHQMGGLPLSFPLLGSGEGSQPFKTVKEYEDWLKRMQQFPAWMSAATENFRKGISTGNVLPKKLVLKMIPQMRASEITSADFNKNIFYGPVRKFPTDFSAEDKERLTALFKKSVTENIIPAYQNMGSFLEKEYLPKARSTDGYNTLPNGDKAYAFYARSSTTTNKTPAEINKIGLQQVAMLRGEMQKVQQQIGFKGTLEEFITHVKSDSKAMPYKTPQEVLAGFNGILEKITPKLKSMFSVTPKTGFEIRQTEKFREASASAEYIQGTPDGKRPGIFYIPIPDPSKFNVTSGMESLFLHEAIPGHHYQFSLQQENTKLPKFMRFGWFTAYGEGWAHYCETLGPEFGLYTDPYQKMGYLSDQMLRAVRLVIDTGLHTGKMSREEAIKYFLSNVSYDEASATAEVERYMAIPGQALGYKIGSLRIRELREKYTKELGSKFNLAKFHDEILNQGCLPLDVLDRKMALWAKNQK